MKPLDTMKKALQDIIARSFGSDPNKIRNIREIAQQALHDHKTNIPRPPDAVCPKGFAVGKEYSKYPACKRCPQTFSQICSLYHFVWYGD